MENICEKCKFWQDDIDIPNFGSCHKYAPRAMVTHPVEGPASMDTIWPRTGKEDWCGMWEAKPQV